MTSFIITSSERIRLESLGKFNLNDDDGDDLDNFLFYENRKVI